jgi:CarD family transcriptional regulator
MPSVASDFPFCVGESIVYPAHGVGQLVAIEEQMIVGMPTQLFVIYFEKDKMTLRVPVAKAHSIGMRQLADKTLIEKACLVLKGRARVKRAMWSRRAQEYDAKIRSGNLITVAEVIRDLSRSNPQSEQSYSERQLCEEAMDRFVREIALVKKISSDEARTLVQKHLSAPQSKAAGKKEELPPVQSAKTPRSLTSHGTASVSITAANSDSATPEDKAAA